jgi:hypothetical protein
MLTLSIQWRVPFENESGSFETMQEQIARLPSPLWVTSVVLGNGRVRRRRFAQLTTEFLRQCDVSRRAKNGHLANAHWQQAVFKPPLE